MTRQPTKPAEILERREAPTPDNLPVRLPLAAALGYSSIQLPSRGVLYGDKVPEGRVQMRKMLAGEQSRLQQQGGSALDRIEAIVNACVKFPPGFTPSELLLTDSFYLMLALRAMSFGPEYTYRYRCRHCGSVEKAKVNVVDDLDETVGDEELVEPIEVQLPDAAVKVAARFLRISDQHLITKYVKRTKLTTSDADDPSYIYRLALALESHDGEPFEDLLRKQDFVKRLTASDCQRLEKAIQDAEPGVDIRVFPDCGGCGASNELALPFDAEFFRTSGL